MKKYDLIVIGGGSAGMAAAITAARSGMSVLVFDAAGPDFDKPCGEGLMPPGARLLEDLGVEVRESHKISGLEIFGFDGGASRLSFFGGRHGLGVRRRALRQALWQRALALGVEIRETRAQKVSGERRHVVVDDVVGSYLIFAGGSFGALSAEFSGFAKRSAVARCGLRRHALIAPWSDQVEVHWSDQFEIYVTPVSRDEINVAVLSWGGIEFDAAVRSVPALAKKLEAVSWTDPVSGRSPLEHRSRWRRRGRIFLCGDAAGFVDAMTGEGNTLALSSGVAAARLIAAGAGWLYPLVWQLIFLRYRVLTITMRRLTRTPKSRRAVLAAFGLLPWIPGVAIWILTIF